MMTAVVVVITCLFTNDDPRRAAHTHLALPPLATVASHAPPNTSACTSTCTHFASRPLPLPLPPSPPTSRASHDTCIMRARTLQRSASRFLLVGTT